MEMVATEFEQPEHLARRVEKEALVELEGGMELAEKDVLASGVPHPTGVVAAAVEHHAVAEVGLGPVELHASPGLGPVGRREDHRRRGSAPGRDPAADEEVDPRSHGDPGARLQNQVGPFRHDDVPR